VRGGHASAIAIAHMRAHMARENSTRLGRVALTVDLFACGSEEHAYRGDAGRQSLLQAGTQISPSSLMGSRGRCHPCPPRCRRRLPSDPRQEAASADRASPWEGQYRESVFVWAVYYKQIRKSEQRPPLHLRAADLVPQPRTPVCHTAIARCKLRQD